MVYSFAVCAELFRSTSVPLLQPLQRAFALLAIATLSPTNTEVQRPLLKLNTLKKECWAFARRATLCSFGGASLRHCLEDAKFHARLQPTLAGRRI